MLSFDVLGRVLEGGATVARSAGCLVVGGHSIDDPEPKYGMAVVGTVDPARILTNAGARIGDVLVLTKPLGSGVIATAIKRGVASAEQVDAAIAVMTTLNASAAAAAAAVGVGVGGAVHAATDVTGFGLIGHLLELAEASDVAIELDADAVPALDGVIDLLDAGVVAGGTVRNHESAEGRIGWGSLGRTAQLLLSDAQTSGGLVLSCDPSAVGALIEQLVSHGTPAQAVIGRVTASAADRIRIRIGS